MSTSTSRRQSAPVNAANTGRSNPTIKNNPAIRSNPTVTCKICAACYRPAPARPDLLQVGPDASSASDAPDALEAAFMSMCHFCFRCRRPACPACWDKVHRICAECVQEAHLFFRSDVPPLQGTLFPATASASSIGQVATDAPLAPLLVCVRAGRFQQEEALDPHIDTKKTVVTAPTQLIQPIQPTQLSQLIQPLQLIQSTEQTQAEADGRRLPEQKGFRNILQTIERVLNVILFSLLVLIVILIMVAELSSTANAQIMVLFHVDVRSEIAYILYIMQQLRR